MAEEQVRKTEPGYYSREAIRERAVERKNQRALEKAYSGMAADDKAASQAYYSGKIEEIMGGAGSDAEKAAQRQAILEEQIASPYATGNSAYDDYANAMLKNYQQAQKSASSAAASSEEALEMQIEQAIAQMERQKPQVEESYQDAQRQAYIQQMQAKKNIGQQMAAMGMTGGAAESSLLDLENNYGSQRAAYQRDRDNAIRDIDYQIGDTRAQGAIQAASLEAQYQQALADMAMNYGQNMANAKLQAQLEALSAEQAAKQLEADLAQQQWERDFRVQEADRDWQLAMDELSWEKEKYGQSQAAKAAKGGGTSYYSGGGGDGWGDLSGEEDENDPAPAPVVEQSINPAAYNGISNNIRKVLQRGGSGSEIASYLLNQRLAGNLTDQEMSVLANQYGAADALMAMLQ